MIIPEIKKILYATDLSKNARYCFGYAASIANQYDARITIIHVLETPGGYTYDLSSYLGAEKWKEIRNSHEGETIKDIKTRLDKFCEEAASECVSFAFSIDEIVVKTGNPVEEILLQAETGNSDMIVMGNYGHGALTDTMMGTTVRRVIRRCKRPVLVVRLPEGEEVE